MKWEVDRDETDVENIVLVHDGVIPDSRNMHEHYGWISLNNNQACIGYHMFTDGLPDIYTSTRQEFDTLEEAKAWLEAAVVYVKVTGEVPPRDIHKREAV